MSIVGSTWCPGFPIKSGRLAEEHSVAKYTRVRSAVFARRKTIRGVAAAFVLVLASASVFAQQYPSKIMRLVVPNNAGGTLDQLARVVGQQLGDAWGRQVLVDNRPGAGGNIGIGAVAKAPADGHTLLLVSVSFTSNPALYRKAAFDPIKDFAPVTLVASSQNALIVHPSVSVKSVRDLIALARSRPGQLNFSSSGVGTSQHLGGELFKSMAQVEMLHVPYKGGQAGLVALLSGEVSLMFNNLFTALPYVKDGRLRALAVTSERRSPVVPNLPTIKEAGLPGYSVSTWYGLLVPAGTPPPVIAKLNSEVGRILNQSETKDRMGGIVELTPSTPEQFSEHIRQEIARWASVVKQSGARVD